MRATVLENPWIPHDPTPKQAEFLLLDDLEGFYGGAGGGGKSEALLMAAAQYVEVPGYAALLLRRTYADLALPEALMDRAREWWTGKARWNDKEKTWTFPSGATVTFGYLENENDKYRYKSAAFQSLFFDELTQFSQTQYTYLFSRLRRLQGSQVPLRVRSASNPDGPGHDWVFQRFIVEGPKYGRPFIPARLEDNPHIDAETYRKSLENLDAVTRAQILDGDWFARPSGRMFKREWFEIIDSAPAGIGWVRFWDLAATEQKPGKDPDWTAGSKVGEYKGVYYVANVVRVKTTPGGVEALIRQTAELDGREVEVWMEQEPGSSGVNTIDHYARTVLKGFAFRGHKTSSSKISRANPVSSAAQAGNVKLVRGPWVNAFLDEAEAFPNPSVHDDQVDSVSGAFAAILFQTLTDDEAQTVVYYQPVRISPV